MDNETVAKGLIEWLRTTLGSLGEQAPLLAQEVITFGLWANGVGCLGFLIAFAICVKLFLKSRPWSMGGEHPWEDDTRSCCAILTSAAGLILFIAVCDTGVHFMHAWLAPRAYFVKTLLH
jgi:hypothetical protein